MGAASGFILFIFFHFFAFEMEKFHFSPEKRVRTAKLSIPSYSAGKIRRNIFFGNVGNFFS